MTRRSVIGADYLTSAGLEARTTVILGPMAEPPTIYEWAGGRDAFARWLDTFYDLVEEDDLLAPVFGGLVTREHRDHVTTWWSEVMVAGGTTPRRSAATSTCSPSTAAWRSRPSSGCGS